MRIGTPALATRGFGDTKSKTLRTRIETLATNFPLYPNLNGGF